MLCEKSWRAPALCLAFPDVWQVVLRASGHPERARQRVTAPAWRGPRWVYQPVLHLPCCPFSWPGNPSQKYGSLVFHTTSCLLSLIFVSKIPVLDSEQSFNPYVHPISLCSTEAANNRISNKFFLNLNICSFAVQRVIVESQLLSTLNTTMC